MANPLLGQILGGLFANAMRGRGGPFGGGVNAGPMTGGAGGGLGDVLGRLGGRGGAVAPGGAATAGRSGNGGMLVAMLLPFAMQWIQRNGGLGAVLSRFQQKGYGQHANSWVSTGANQMLDTSAVNDVVGMDELSRLSQQLGVPQEEVSHGFAEILPEMVNQLTPDGKVSPEADEALNGGLTELQQALARADAGLHA